MPYRTMQCSRATPEHGKVYAWAPVSRSIDDFIGNGSLQPDQIAEPIILKSLAAKSIVKVAVSATRSPHVLACATNGQLFRYVVVL